MCRIPVENGGIRRRIQSVKYYKTDSCTAPNPSFRKRGFAHGADGPNRFFLLRTGFSGRREYKKRPFPQKRPNEGNEL